MLFYILFICIVLSLFFLSRVFPDGSRRYYFFELVGLFVIIFIGIFRFDVGWDYINYYNYIDKSESDYKTGTLESDFLYYSYFI